jgi:hypothetical protein
VWYDDTPLVRRDADVGGVDGTVDVDADDDDGGGEGVSNMEGFRGVAGGGRTPGKYDRTGTYCDGDILVVCHGTRHMSHDLVLMTMVSFTDIILII